MFGAAVEERGRIVGRFLAWLQQHGYAIGYCDDEYTVLLDEPEDAPAVSRIVAEYLRWENDEEAE